MAKRQVHEEHENHERWLVSYADFITLLFAFFVVMYSISRVDNKRMQKVATSIKWAMHVSGTGGIGALPIFDGPPSEGGCAADIGEGHPQQQMAPEAAANLQTIKKRIQRRLRQLLMDHDTQKNTVLVNIEGKRLVIRLAVSHFFDPAVAALRPESLPVLDAVASELGALDRPIRIEGHTDSSPLRNPRYKNNWDLSAARAATVANYVEQAHFISSDNLQAVGFASTHPVAKGDSPEAREANRRVELVVDLSPNDSMNAAGK